MEPTRDRSDDLPIWHAQLASSEAQLGPLVIGGMTDWGIESEVNRAAAIEPACDRRDDGVRLGAAVSEFQPQWGPQWSAGRRRRPDHAAVAVGQAAMKPAGDWRDEEHTSAVSSSRM
jgi:hypothetical protein